jgi:hypothetical protein
MFTGNPSDTKIFASYFVRQSFRLCLYSIFHGRLGPIQMAGFRDDKSGIILVR